MHYVIETCDRYGCWSDDPAMLGHGLSEADNHWHSYREADQARTALVMIGMDPDRIRIVTRD